MSSKALKDMILWLRKERISYVTLTAGGITIDGVVDGKMDRGKAEKPEPRRSMFEERIEELQKMTATAPAAAVTDEERLAD